MQCKLYFHQPLIALAKVSWKLSFTYLFPLIPKLIHKYINVSTPNTPLIHTSFTYSKLNMDDFFVLTGLLGYLEVELKSLHVQTWTFLLLNFVIWGKNPTFIK